MLASRPTPGIRIAAIAVAALLFCGNGDRDVFAESPTPTEDAIVPAALSLPAGSGPSPERWAAVNAARNSLASAVEQAWDDGLGRPTLPGDELSYRRILDPDRAVEGSLSQGTIRSGALQDGASLVPIGDHHEILATHRPRQTHYGTSELVEAIERAAQHVAATHGGAPLRVGNLSYRRGGRIPWSSSHQAGRDADLAFYTVDQDGQSVPAPGLLGFDDDGQALEHPLAFDIPRNWALVEALLTDPHIKVQWLFVSEGLKSLLLMHAIDSGAPTDLIERASKVLHQPTDAPPHDDHLHLRIGCAQTDRLEGCIDWGPQWPWHDWHEDALFARTRQLQEAFGDPDPELRRRALAYLHEIASPFAAFTAIYHGLGDDDEQVRQQAFEILDDLPLRSTAGLVTLDKKIREWAPAGDEEDRLILYQALRTAQHPLAADIAWHHYRDETLSLTERSAAIDALAHRMKPHLVPKLIEALDDEPSPELRARLAHQLRRITARSDGLDWSKHPLEPQHLEALADWRQWWDETEPDREEFLRQFARHLGADHWRDLEAIEVLITNLRSTSDYRRYNINRLLSRWTGRWTPREWDTEQSAYQFWTRWWDRNRERVLDDTPWPWEKALAEP